MSRNLIIAFLLVLGLQAFTQSKVPSVDLKTLDGKVFNTADMACGKPVVVSFWATWCIPCQTELSTIAEEYSDWQEETGVVLYAISIDDSRTSSRVKALVNSKDWPFEVLLDVNSDFKRATNVVNVPHTFLLDQEGKIVYQKSGFAAGEEEELLEKIKELLP